MAHPPPILDGQRAIQPQLVAHRRHLLHRRVLAEDRARRIARHEPEQEENERRHAENLHDEVDQPARDIASHAVASLLSGQVAQ